ncbi:OadG family transporter subunit [Coprobacter tertius]|uniref:OadG family transporter subunit n=1 Tax=Coprobacter tertius TaxID=2944915 RepID=A0ABT1MKU5_9BACT|nr:OadG family transporter subunit [Coprobacter tertius]MCP9612491.1 OadG family transporter subunit [Coprobacter tertius]
MIKKIIGGALLAFGLIVGAHAQSTSSLRINEVLTNNVSNYMDPFGNRGAWIEIYNNSAATVQMAGCYITNEKNNPKKYMISKGDLRTQIGPRQVVLLWADALPHHGTFHTNFELNPDKENYIALYDASGKNLIDEITVPVLDPDQSFGAPQDGSRDLKVLPHPTPEASNFVINNNPKVENFAEHDPDGVGMALTAMSVVFLALIALYVVFRIIGKISVRLSTRRAMKAQGISGKVKDAQVENEIPGAVLAAIAMALNEHQGGDHDYEDTVLTIHRVARNYSPWSSKIYGLRETPHLKK